mmetsp:Transcript_38381/g.127077  ORF Transcript_38381/g.127077 Transcript_38381/m.127077 type:complete len:217 (-) Transcript_38381:1035-1685(-)
MVSVTSWQPRAVPRTGARGARGAAVSLVVVIAVGDPHAPQPEAVRAAAHTRYCVPGRSSATEKSPSTRARVVPSSGSASGVSGGRGTRPFGATNRAACPLSPTLPLMLSHVATSWPTIFTSNGGASGFARAASFPAQSSFSSQHRPTNREDADAAVGRHFRFGWSDGRSLIAVRRPGAPLATQAVAVQRRSGRRAQTAPRGSRSMSLQTRLLCLRQ